MKNVQAEVVENIRTGEKATMVVVDEAYVEAIKLEIFELANAERITKKLLGSLSRSLLEYYHSVGNVDLINNLLGVDDKDRFILTPMNWRLAVQYFRAFIPHASNWDELKDVVQKGGKREPFVFGKKSGNRAKKLGDSLEKWLAVDTNNIWVFSDSVEVIAKPVDYAGQITKAIEKAMDEDKGGLGEMEVFTAIFAADGMSVQALIAAMEAANIERTKDKEEQPHTEAA